MMDVENAPEATAREAGKLLIEYDLTDTDRYLRYVRFAEYGLVFIGLPSAVSDLLLLLSIGPVAVNLGSGEDALMIPNDWIAAVALIGFGIVASLSIGKIKLGLWPHYLWILPLAAVATVWGGMYQMAVLFQEYSQVPGGLALDVLLRFALAVIAVRGMSGILCLRAAHLTPSTFKILDVLRFVESIRRGRGAGSVPGRPINRGRGIIFLVLGIIALLFLGKLGWVLGGFFLIRSRQNFQASADSVLGLDQRPPILFLRSFVDDVVDPTAGDEPPRGFQRITPLENLAEFIDFSVETRLAHHFMNFGPFIAIGSSREKVPVPGAVRVKLSDDEWQQWVTQRMESAVTIVMYAGVTHWVDWELEQVIERGLTGKLILVFPRPVLPKRPRIKRKQRPARVAEDLENRLVRVKAAFSGTRWEQAWEKIDSPSTLIAARIEDSGTVTTFRSHQRDNDMFQIAVEIAHLAILGNPLTQALSNSIPPVCEQPNVARKSPRTAWPRIIGMAAIAVPIVVSIGLMLTDNNIHIVNNQPASSPVSSTEQWAEFLPAEVNYSIEMPGKWTITVKNLDTDAGKLKMHIASVSLPSGIYSTMYVAYPSEIMGKPITPILDGARDGTIRTTGAKLRKEERIVISKRPGREIILDAPDNHVIAARFFLLDNFLIQALVVGQEGIEGDPNTNRFLRSLKVR
jgi:hypothetical protein